MKVVPEAECVRKRFAARAYDYRSDICRHTTRLRWLRRERRGNGRERSVRFLTGMPLFSALVPDLLQVGALEFGI